MPKAFVKDIGMRVHKLTCLIGRAAEQTLRKVDNLTFAQFRILMVLQHSGTLSQRKIAKYHGLTEAAVSRMLSPLQRDKFIKLIPDPNNRRTNQITLTSQGVRTAEKAMHLLDAHFTKAFKSLDTTQCNALLITLDSLIKGLTKEKV